MPLMISAQSPWLPAKGGYFAQLAYQSIPTYTGLFNSSPDPIEISREVAENTIQGYGEYGLSDRWAVQLSLPYKLLKSGALNPGFTGDIAAIPDEATLNALGNVQFGLKYKLSSDKWTSALLLRVELPTNPAEAEKTGLYPGYDAVSVSPLASIGRGWKRSYFYYWLSGIYRSNNFSDYLDTGIEGGYKLTSSLWAIAYFQWMYSLQNGSRALPPPEKQFGLFANNNEYLAFGLKILYEIPTQKSTKFGIIAGTAGSFTGFQVAHSPYLSIGVYVKK